MACSLTQSQPECAQQIPPSFAQLSHTKRLAQRISSSGNTPVSATDAPSQAYGGSSYNIRVQRIIEHSTPSRLTNSPREAMSNAKVYHRWSSNDATPPAIFFTNLSAIANHLLSTPRGRPVLIHGSCTQNLLIYMDSLSMGGHYHHHPAD